MVGLLSQAETSIIIEAKVINEIDLIKPVRCGVEAPVHIHDHAKIQSPNPPFG